MQAVQNTYFNPDCTGLFCAMKILGGGALEVPLQISESPQNLARTSEIVHRERPQCYFS